MEVGEYPWSNPELTDGEFEKISRLVYEACGINLTEGKKELLKARLGKIIRAGGFGSFREYYEHVLQDSSGQELVHLLDAVSTNFTSFFREPQHFEYLKSEFLPEVLRDKGRNGRKLRFWSAGCSSGEEPYSIIISLLENLESPRGWDLQVLSTDLSSKILQAAAAGIYPKGRIQTISPGLVKKYFLRGENQWKGYVRVKDSLKKYLVFRRLNLMEPFSFAEPFDGIFCRNVMIYFDKPTQASLLKRFFQNLGRGGVLFIGHSESLAGIEHPFRYVQPATYRKEL